MAKQNPICGRIGEKVTSNHSHMAQSNLCENLFGFSHTVLGNQARSANLMEAGRADRSSQRRDNAVPYGVQIFSRKLFTTYICTTNVPPHSSMPCKKNEYEKTNSLSRCDIRLTSSCHLWRRTGRIFDASCCSAAWVLQIQRIRCWSVRDLCYRLWLWRKCRQAARLGGGMDSTYWFPWKYAGVRFQGDGSK